MENKTKKSGKNIILTGPPRSGTTLSCHLLNKLTNVVALHEPMNLKMFPTKEEGLKNIPLFFEEMRTLILEKGKAISRVKDGQIPDNPFQSGSESRKSTVRKELFTLANPPINAEFTLVIKHNAHFSFLLEELRQNFDCYAIIRNPLAVLASWNTIKAPVSEGNLKVLKGLNPQLEQDLWKIPEVLDRQVHLLDILFRQIKLLPSTQIIFYEEIIRTGGKALSPICEQAITLNEKLSNTNLTKRYPQQLIELIFQKLISNKGDNKNWNDFYPPSEFEKIMNVYL